MFVNRGELKVQHDYAGMTDEQRMRWAYQVLQQARAVLDAPEESEPPLIEGKVEQRPAAGVGSRSRAGAD